MGGSACRTPLRGAAPVLWLCCALFYLASGELSPSGRALTCWRPHLECVDADFCVRKHKRVDSTSRPVELKRIEARYRPDPRKLQRKSNQWKSSTLLLVSTMTSTHRLLSFFPRNCRFAR